MSGVFEPPVVRVIKPRWEKCALCGQRKDEMIYVKDLNAIVCPEHGAYAVVWEFDNGYERVQEVVSLHATEEEASKEKEYHRKTLLEARAAVGWRPESYFVTPLWNLLNQKASTYEVEEDMEESW